jgi:hypothetical protein
VTARGDYKLSVSAGSRCYLGWHFFHVERCDDRSA